MPNSPPTDHLGPLLRLMSIYARRCIEECLHRTLPADITDGQSRIIGYVYHAEGDVFQRDLEAHFGCRRSTLTAMLQNMEKKDLLRRESVARDARLKKLCLTPRALALQQQIDRQFEQLEAQFVRGISPAELQTFFAVSKKLLANMTPEPPATNLPKEDSRL